MGIGADPLYHKNVDSLYCLFDSGNDPSVSWTYSMVKRMGKDLGNTGKNKCRSGVRRGTVNISEYYAAI